MAIVPHVIPAAGGRLAMTIYAETANINYFLKTALVPAIDAGASNKTVTFKGHSRRQYPGDTATINVPGGVREILLDPTRKSGNGLPGRSIVLVADHGEINEQRRQFTLKGRWVDFHAFLTGQAKMEIFAYNSTGARSTIKAAST